MYSGVASAGRDIYLTTVSRTPGTVQTVYKAGFTVGEDNELIWAQQDTTMQVVIEPNPFASGLTKHAYKVSTLRVVYSNDRLNIG